CSTPGIVARGEVVPDIIISGVVLHDIYTYGTDSVTGIINLEII
ncbi:9899_t:CDS:1, partial [Diversispora eburnea]